ncbi:MAG: endopeptidase La [Anaerolineales bacterium]|nr:endopeptidase La [Anaerolineales bacterium]
MKNNYDNWYLDDEDEDDEDFEFGEILQRRTEELYDIPDTQPDHSGVIECPVLPLRDIVIFPRMVSPLFIGREISLMAIEVAQDNHQTVIALTQSNPDVDEPGPDDFIPIGVEMAVGRLLSMPDGSSSALVQGRRRVEIIEFIRTEPYLYVRARPINDEPVHFDRETEALMRTVLDMFERCVQMSRSIPEEAHLFALNIDDPGWLADMIATALSLTIQDRHLILTEINPVKRLQLVSNFLAREIDVLELEDQIHTRIQNEVDKSQREHYLREQMRAIQTELGEGDTWNQELSELRARVEGAPLPEEVKSRALKEVSRLAQLPPMSPETGILRTYIDTILELPWVKATEDNLDVRHASNILEQYHYGLPKVKERILEYIAVRSLKPKKQRQPILCFSGPPGTGKTSLGRSIAEALGRKFVRLSLGGVRDEAEIRGHRRTYIGALPGRILQTMRRAETVNPLFMLDEIDKISSDYRGDPAAALLEVLDPEQNNQFSDHYLEINYDLSKVMFITTANNIGRIPAPLLDRMEVIEFDGYIEDEKIEIARRFLIPRQLEENGLEDADIVFSTQALQRIIREYTYEAGVRNLEREIGRVCRKVARAKAEHKRYPARIHSQAIEKLLGPPQFFNAEAEREDEIGIATALAWTENGGDIMPVEVALIDGKGNLQITGQIGEVMQESAQAALSYLKSRAGQFKLNTETFENTDIHIHIPEGAIPKDGPSAGITIGTALISAFTQLPVRKEVAMTGEITLRGRVLPVGGVREKIMAAHRAGLKKVIIPKLNAKDLVDLPKRVRADIQIMPVDHMDQVLEIALLSPTKPVQPARAKRIPAPPREVHQEEIRPVQY